MKEAVGQSSFQQRRKQAGRAVSEPIVKFISGTGVTPDMLTWIGFFLAVAAAGIIANHWWLAGGLLVLFGGLFDMLDGALARYTGRVSRFGAVLDSTLDRAGEGVILTGLAYALAMDGSVAGVTLVAGVMLFSFLVSYIRSRAESIELYCQEGIFTRPERIVIISLGLIFDYVIIALAIIAFFSIITAAQWLIVVWRKTRAE